MTEDNLVPYLDTFVFDNEKRQVFINGRFLGNYRERSATERAALSHIWRERLDDMALTALTVCQ